ncbi:zinc finger protein OZF-like [Sitodiplosis mosellana]|uniref:zinc finger protein OZF-like n=1 Tax=Sitodiplosis mosellana TaxID=263140 RepID=UPI002444ACC2|nr:zinc finger protein OZF-like [Sitodiplosis mosellana]
MKRMQLAKLKTKRKVITIEIIWWRRNIDVGGCADIAIFHRVTEASRHIESRLANQHVFIFSGKKATANIMNPFRGVSGRRCKCKSKPKQVKIKQDPELQEHNDNDDVINVSRPRVDGRYCANYEGPAYDFDDIKDEIKCEEEETDKENDAEPCERSNGRANANDDYENEMSGVVDVQPPQPVESGKKGIRNAKKQNKRMIPRNKAMKKQKKHKCEVCDHMTLSKSKLITHLRIHTGEKPFQCDVCSNTSSRKYNLILHKKTHGQFHCVKCNQRFDQESVITDHERLCNPRQFECDICEYKTKFKSNLTRHMRIHSGEKPSECSICFKSFTTNSQLLRHSMTHKDELPHACSKCGRRFTSLEDKRIHEKRCQRSLIACNQCHYKTVYKHCLKQHMQWKHGAKRSIECEICSKEFIRQLDLNRHLSTIHSAQFPFECSKCFGGYATEGMKNAHEESCGRRQYRCHLCEEYCRSKHVLKIHIRKDHTGERIQCEVCDARFISKSHVNQHMRTVHHVKKK